MYRSSVYAVDEPKEEISSVTRITADFLNGVVADFQLQMVLGFFLLFSFILFVRLLALRPRLAYCASLG
jgi:hypothetical protein